jgi:hypothetical protein
LGDGQDGLARRWDGLEWRSVELPAVAAGDDLNVVRATSGYVVMASEEGRILEKDGAAAAFEVALDWGDAFYGDGRRRVRRPARRRRLLPDHRSNYGAWSQPTYQNCNSTSYDLRAADGTEPNDALAVGDYGLAVWFDGSRLANANVRDEVNGPNRDYLKSVALGGTRSTSPGTRRTS